MLSMVRYKVHLWVYPRTKGLWLFSLLLFRTKLTPCVCVSNWLGDRPAGGAGDDFLRGEDGGDKIFG